VNSKLKLQQILLGVKLLHDRRPHQVGTEPKDFGVSDIGLEAITQFIEQVDDPHIYGELVSVGVRSHDINTYVESCQPGKFDKSRLRLKVCHSGEVYLQVGNNNYWIKEDYSIKYLDLIPELIRLDKFSCSEEYKKIRTRLSQWVKMEAIAEIKSKLDATLLLAHF
jgi:hypothetical protein